MSVKVSRRRPFLRRGVGPVAPDATWEPVAIFKASEYRVVDPPALRHELAADGEGFRSFLGGSELPIPSWTAEYPMFTEEPRIFDELQGWKDEELGPAITVGRYGTTYSMRWEPRLPWWAQALGWAIAAYYVLERLRK